MWVRVQIEHDSNESTQSITFHMTYKSFCEGGREGGRGGETP